jgi:hypothetical protein
MRFILVPPVNIIVLFFWVLGQFHLDATEPALLANRREIPAGGLAGGEAAKPGQPMVL